MSCNLKSDSHRRTSGCVQHRIITGLTQYTVEVHSKEPLRRFCERHFASQCSPDEDKWGSLPYSKIHWSNCWFLHMRYYLMGLQISGDDGAQGWQKWVEAVLLIRQESFNCELHYSHEMFSSTEVNRSGNILPLCPEIIWAECDGHKS